MGLRLHVLGLLAQDVWRKGLSPCEGHGLLSCRGDTSGRARSSHSLSIFSVQGSVSLAVAEPGLTPRQSVLDLLVGGLGEIF